MRNYTTSYKTYSRNPAVSLPSTKIMSIFLQIDSQVPLKTHDIYSTFLSGDTGKRDHLLQKGSRHLQETRCL